MKKASQPAFKTKESVSATWRQSRKPLSALEQKARLEERDAWVREIDSDYLFHRLFDAFPGCYFFAKNRQEELMFLSQSEREIYRLGEADDVIGLTDFDLNPEDMARSFVQDDERIFTTGESLLNRVELWFDQQGVPDWFVVNKMPIRSRAGEIIGIMGFSQVYDGQAQSLPLFHEVAKVVDYIRQHYAEDIELAELAGLAGLSPRQLQRKFKAVFGVGPQRFLIKTRLLAACAALQETDASVAQIASTCGFSDQSAFARQFHQHIGMTPKKFRRQQLMPGAESI